MPNHSLLLVAAASACVAAAPAARARDLTVALRPGPFADVVRRFYVEPFAAASGTPVTQLAWTGGLDAVRAHAGAPAAAPPSPAAPVVAPPAAPVVALPGASASGVPPSSPPPPNPVPIEADWDLMEVDGDVLSAGCAEGLFQKLDWARLGTRDHYLPQAVSDCGVGAFLRDTVLAWDHDKFPGTPTWADFWDVAKHPGKRGLHRGPRLTLEIALLADGVPPADIYATLRTDEGVDRAFRKLDQLKPYIVWWDREEQAPQLLASGDVLLTAAANDGIAAANAAGHGSLGMSWVGGLQSVASWALLRGSPQAAPAYALLSAMGDPRREAALEAALPLGGPARGATEGLPPDALAASPAAPANLLAILPVDEAFWHDNLDRLDRRYATWLAR